MRHAPGCGAGHHDWNAARKAEGGHENRAHQRIGRRAGRGHDRKQERGAGWAGRQTEWKPEQIAAKKTPGRLWRWCERRNDDVDDAQQRKARYRQNECEQGVGESGTFRESGPSSSSPTPSLWQRWRTGCCISKMDGSGHDRTRTTAPECLLRRPARPEGGFRRCSLRELQRLAFIRRGRELGFTLDEVRALLRLAEDRRRSCAEVRDLAAAHLTDVRTKIADLRKMERILHGMVLECADGTLPNCPLIDALFDAKRGVQYGLSSPHH